MRRRWQNCSESDRIAVYIVVFAVLGMLYFVWPTPYIDTYKVLPQSEEGSEVATIAIYRVRMNRITGTVWADTIDGWRRFRSQPLPESQLGFKEQGAEWYDERYRPTP